MTESKAKTWTCEGRQWADIGALAIDDGKHAERTSAMQLPTGLLVRVSSRKGATGIAEAMCFVPGATLHQIKSGGDYG